MKPSHRNAGKLLFAALAALVPAAARAGLDPTFGHGGVVNTAFPGDAFAYGVVVDPDGKVVASGFTRNGAPPTPTPAAATVTNEDFALARYHPDGSLDDDFGDGGVVVASLSNGDERGFALVVQPDGKVVEAGSSCHPDCSFALARFNRDGSRDDTFGDGGQVITRVSDRNAAANALVLQPDGKLVAAGSDDSGFVLARYLDDGSLDRSFGDEGVVRTAIEANGAWARALVIEPDGKLVAAGHSCTDTCAFAVVRYAVDGQLDRSFGHDGVSVTDLGTRSAVASALVRQPDGKLIVGGANDRDFVLIRYNSDGSLDPSFGRSGIATTSVNDGYDEARALMLQADGKVLAAGYAAPFVPRAGGFALLRYDRDGQLDQSFGSGGIEIGPPGSAEAIALQSDGAVVVAGHAMLGDKSGVVVARYTNDVTTERPPATPTSRATVSPPPTPTAARDGGTSVSIDVGDAVAHPGAAVTVSVTLASNGLGVAGVQNDLIFDPAVMELVSEESCRINPIITASAAGCDDSNSMGACKSLFHRLRSCAETFDCPADAVGKQLVRVIIMGLTNANPIPDGELYSCTFLTHGGEGTFVLENRGIGAASTTAESLPTNGRDGVVTLIGPSTTPAPKRTPTVTPTFVREPHPSPPAIGTATPLNSVERSPAATPTATPVTVATAPAIQGDVPGLRSASGSSGSGGCTVTNEASSQGAVLSIVPAVWFARRRQVAKRRSLS